MNDKTITHSVTTEHELSEHAAVLVLGTETQSNLILGLNGVQAMLALLASDNKDLLSPLLRKNLHGGCAVLIEHLRNVACGEGFDAYRLEPDSASELLELAEKLAMGG
jgi:hypothetical protein